MNSKLNQAGAVTLELSADEALVLFEFLTRTSEHETPELFDDQAEEKVLWLLEGALQRILVEPFRPDYDALLLNARNRIRDEPAGE